MEINRIEAWLTQRLGGDATLAALAPGGVHAEINVAEAAFPYVVFELQKPEDVLTLNARRVMTQAVYLVRAIGRDCGAADLQAAADRIDALLGWYRAEGLLTGGGVRGCYREAPFKLIELEGGVVYPHLGGLYRIIVQ